MTNIAGHADSPSYTLKACMRRGERPSWPSDLGQPTPWIFRPAVQMPSQALLLACRRCILRPTILLFALPNDADWMRGGTPKDLGPSSPPNCRRLARKTRPQQPLVPQRLHASCIPPLLLPPLPFLLLLPLSLLLPPPPPPPLPIRSPALWCSLPLTRLPQPQSLLAMPQRQAP